MMKQVIYGFGTYNGLMDLALTIVYKEEQVNCYASFILNGKDYKYVINPAIAHYPEDPPLLRHLCWKSAINSQRLISGYDAVEWENTKQTESL
jgi:hypothetical protein